MVFHCRVVVSAINVALHILLRRYLLLVNVVGYSTVMLLE